LPRSTKAATRAVIDVFCARMALQPSTRCVEVRLSLSEHQEALPPADGCRATAGATVRADNRMAAPIRANDLANGLVWFGKRGILRLVDMGSQTSGNLH